MNKLEKFGLALIFSADVARNIDAVLGVLLFVLGVAFLMFGDDLGRHL